MLLLIQVLAKESAGHGMELMKVSVLLPHEVFAWLWTTGLGAENFLGTSGEAGLRQFWQRSLPEEWFQQHGGALYALEDTHQGRNNFQ